MAEQKDIHPAQELVKIRRLLVLIAQTLLEKERIPTQDDWALIYSNKKP